MPAFARHCAQEDVPVGPGPFLSGCGGTIAGSYVTIRQVGRERYLTIPEVEEEDEADEDAKRHHPDDCDA